jgi:hypothetical protein
MDDQQNLFHVRCDSKWCYDLMRNKVSLQSSLQWPSYQVVELFRNRSIVLKPRIRLAFLLQPQDFTRWGWHLRALRNLVVLLEIVRHLLHRHPLYAFMFVDVLDDPAQS